MHTHADAPFWVAATQFHAYISSEKVDNGCSCQEQLEMTEEVPAQEDKTHLAETGAPS